MYALYRAELPTVCELYFRETKYVLGINGQLLFSVDGEDYCNLTFENHRKLEQALQGSTTIYFVEKYDGKEDKRWSCLLL